MATTYRDFKISRISQETSGTTIVVREYSGSYEQVEVEPGVFEEQYVRSGRTREHTITPAILEQYLGKRSVSYEEIIRLAAQFLSQQMRPNEVMVAAQAVLLQ